MKFGNRSVNIAYALAQSGYWMSLCVSLTCAAVFLQARGYSNTQLGLVIGIGSALAFVLSPLLGGVVDRSERITTRHMLWFLLIAQGLVIAGFYLFTQRSAALSVCYSLYIAFNTCLVPLITQLCFDMECRGYRVNFGVARGIGSLAFAVAAVILGRLVESFSTDLLIPTGLGMTAFQMFVVLFFSLCCRTAPVSVVPSDGGDKGSTMLGFIRENKRFCGLMAGVALIFFTHHLVDSFLINIVRNIGGDTADLGNINAFMAVLELPAMLMYAKISKKIGCERGVLISVLFFPMKALLIALSTRLGFLYFAHSMQGLSYALFTPALVEYVELHIPHKDSARAQAVSYAMNTLGGIFASMLGGRMFDVLSVRTTVLIGAAVSFTGMCICRIFTEKPLPHMD